MRRLLVIAFLAALGAAGGLGYWLHGPTRALIDGTGRWADTEARKLVSGLGSAGTTKSNNAPAAKKGGPPPAPVTVASAVERDMPILLAAPGSVEPMATVAIKARVDGQVIEVAFKEGDTVTAGQILFKLDDRLALAQIRQAEAIVTRDRANLKDAEQTLARRETLVKSKVVTEASTETQRQLVEQLKASIAAGAAQLEMQKTQLDYLVIRAPITGRTGSLAARLGATVRAADATPLVTINQTRPIAVAFAVAQTELPLLRKALDTKAKADVIAKAVPPYTATGTMTFVDNQVDKSTGTVLAKVMVENTDELLWPGQAVEVVLTVEVRPRMVAVPAAAVLPAQQGMIVWLLGPDNRVSVRPVTVDRIVGQTAFLAQGLGPGERVVTDGQVRLAPGAPVRIIDPSAPPATSDDQTKGKKKGGGGRS